MKLAAALDMFLEQKAIQGCSSKTLKCYTQVIVPFVEFAGADCNLSPQIISGYLSALRKRDLTRATYSSYVRQLKVFIRWLEEEYSLDLLSSKIKIPKSYKKFVHIYSDDEIKLIFDSVEAESSWLIYRNCAMISLMLDSGLRQGEVADLLFKNIDFDKGLLKVLGKGHKERIVPFGNLSRYYMDKYYKACPFTLDTNFFLSRRGEYVTTDAIKHFISKMSGKLPFDFSSHRLRHNFATNYCLDQYERTGQVDLYRLMILMGHSDIETTRLYLHHANQIIASISAISHLDKVLLEK